jgi:hypothetical protein
MILLLVLIAAFANPNEAMFKDKWKEHIARKFEEGEILGPAQDLVSEQKYENYFIFSKYHIEYIYGSYTCYGAFRMIILCHDN